MDWRQFLTVEQLVKRQRAFDAVLIVAFGGPNGPEDVRPFLENVVRGKGVPPARLDEVAGHYEMFGGVSGLTAVTDRQAEGLRQRLQKTGVDLPVYVGMRHWHPMLADTFRQMADEGVRRAIAFVASAHHSYASCTEYKLAVRAARQSLIESGGSDIEICYVDSWFDHELFVQANAERVRQALTQLEPADRQRARIVFTAHSLPVAMADACQYREQLNTTARLVAEQLGRTDWAIAYQSRTGPPNQPWLEPDVRDYLRAEHEKGLEAVVLSPIGFIADHVEVLYDLHHVAGELCRSLDIPVGLASTVGDHPLFLDMIADVVLRSWQRFAKYPFLPITSDS